MKFQDWNLNLLQIKGWNKLGTPGVKNIKLKMSNCNAWFMLVHTCIYKDTLYMHY